ncbi:hypothetical protein [Chitinibacter sp. S2-10]|uniref:hypothetical protein n=1 Tax=Chitinibacter sp. S2-10 TaxID=3373597 RepID=UPI003977A088
MMLDPKAVAVKALVCLGIGAAGFGVGAYVAWDWTSAHAKNEIADLKIERQDEVIASFVAAQAGRDAAELRANAISIELAHARNALAETRVQLSRNIQRVTTVYRPAPNATPVPLPACVFTTGFVHDWNAANGIEQADQAASGAADQASAAEEADGLYPSGVTQSDILTNHIDNATRCRAIESQLSGLIDWHHNPTESAEVQHE